MFSQSLLLALWRDTAAEPDSSASSHAETTPGSSPVWLASSEANCCWPEVSIVPALAGSDVPPVAVVPDVPNALLSALENVIDAPVAVDAVEPDDDVVVVAGVNAV